MENLCVSCFYARMREDICGIYCAGNFFKKEDGTCERYLDDRKSPKMERMTNADRIRSMSDEELADFLSGIAYARATPWSEAFMPLCKACKGVECTFEDGHREILHECEFSDFQCPHGHEISWWLKQTAEDEDG